MHKLLFFALVTLGLVPYSFASTQKSSLKPLTVSLEALRLPSANRQVFISEHGLEHYNNFAKVAFDEEQSMNLRWNALMAMAQVKGEKGTADLLKASQSKAWYMRNAALVALSQVAPAQGKNVALKLMKDKALVVRSAAVVALENETSQEVRDLLWEELHQKYNFKKTQSLWIRHQIVEALSKHPQDRELKLFAQLLSDKDERLHAPSIAGLEKITGVRLTQEAKTSKVGLWKEYLKKEKIEL